MFNHTMIGAFPTWFVVVESVSLALLLILMIVSFALYVIEIQIIFSFRKTTFRGPFYRLMFVGIIVDMLSAVNLFTGQVIPARKWFSSFLLSNQSWLGAIFFFITYSCRCVQGATATILSFCRVSAVLFPIVYRKLGQPTYIYILQALQLSGVVLAGWILIPQNYEYLMENDGFYSVDSSDDESEALWFYNLIVILEVFFVSSIVVNNLVTYIAFHLKFSKNPPIRSNIVSGPQYQISREKQKRESSLDRMTFIVCCVELVYFAYVVYSLQINVDMNKRVFYFWYNILCVMYSTFSAWMLLLVSKPITLQFKQRFQKLAQGRLVRSVSISAHGGSRDNHKPS